MDTSFKVYVAKLLGLLHTQAWEWTDSSLAELATISGAHFVQKTVVYTVCASRFQDEHDHRWSVKTQSGQPYECRITVAREKLSSSQPLSVNEPLTNEWEQLIGLIPQHIDSAAPLDEAAACKVHPPASEVGRMRWWSCKWGYVGVAVIQPHLNMAVWLDLILQPPFIPTVT